MKKALLVSHSQKLGGAEKCLIELATGLVGEGWQVYVSLPAKGENYNLFKEVVKEVIIVSYPWWVHDKDGWSGSKLLRKQCSQLYAVFKFLRIISKVNPDVVFSNTVTVPSAAIASFLKRKKHLWFIHELATEDHRLHFDIGLRRSCAIVNRTSRKVFVNSEFVRQKFTQYIPDRKLQIINYAIAAPQTGTFSLKRTEDYCPNLYLIGQISEAKGHLDAIKAHYILRSSGIKSSLYIIGQQSDAAFFEKISFYVKENNISDVHFIDHCSNPFTFIKGFPIGLVCSRHEAFGRITIEYMKSGIPVIGANAGNTPALVKNGQYGLLYEAGNPKDLANSILSLNNRQEFVEKITEQAKGYADSNFNAAQYTHSILQFLEN